MSKVHFLTPVNLFHSLLTDLGPPCQTPVVGGSLSLFFISEEKSSPRADICLLLALSFLSRLANFVRLNGTFKLFLHYDSLSWQGVKYNNRNRAEQKIMLEKKKAGQTGRVIHVTLRKKLNV